MNIEEQNKSITIRFAIVAALAAVLIIPTLLIGALVSERWSFFREAVDEIKDTWSSDQVIIGPTIMVPVSDTDGDERQFQRVVYMPKTLDMQIDSTHEFRTRTIFTTPVLSLKLTASGEFEPIDLKNLATRHEHVHSNHILMSFAVTDVRGITDVELLVEGQSVPVTVSETGFGKSLNAKVPMQYILNGGDFQFSASMRASDGVHVVPHADSSTITIVSSWPHPKFDGDILPETREVSDSGFVASWQGNAISRGFNQTMYLPGTGITYQGEMVGPWGETNYRQSAQRIRSYQQDSSTLKSMDPFGRDLIQVGFTVLDPVTPYRKVSRTVNYGILFIILTFGVILSIELVMPVQFHYVQYLVIGTSLVIYFLTLLSISEHLPFGQAYLIAASLMTIMLTGYTHLAAKVPTITGAVFLLLLLLYSVLYLILRLENYALLVGTSLLLLLLAVLMWATKNLTMVKDRATSEETTS